MIRIICQHASRAAGVVGALALLSASAAYGQNATDEDWRQNAPGRTYHITPESMPAPYATPSASAAPSVVRRPAGAELRVPRGFRIAPFASGLERPRVIRRAPNGDMFLAESGAGRIRVFRAGETGPNAASTVFATGLDQPFGIAFWPPADPQYIYVAETSRVVRYPYRAGDTRARGPAETVVPDLPTGGHWTRDLAAAPDGSVIYLSVGSNTNLGGEIGRTPPGGLAAWERDAPLGAAWGDEARRADVLTIDPRSNTVRTFATGIRNCAGLAIDPGTGAPWCATNERDGLGNNLPPDYATSVRQGAFYGWPWYYIGDHEEPRLRGARPDLADKVTVPDVLIQAHSAPLGITFYDGTSFPADYRGSAFVALHGSWNRSQRTGYKIIRLLFQNGRPTGAYEDFVTGFVASNASVWGRPVDVAVTGDGSLLFTEDGNGTVWRVSYGG